MNSSQAVRFTAGAQVAFLNGNQALIRTLAEQMRADREAGLLTRGFVTDSPNRRWLVSTSRCTEAQHTLEAHERIFHPSLLGFLGAMK